MTFSEINAIAIAAAAAAVQSLPKTLGVRVQDAIYTMVRTDVMQALEDEEAGDL